MVQTSWPSVSQPVRCVEHERGCKRKLEGGCEEHWHQVRNVLHAVLAGGCQQRDWQKWEYAREQYWGVSPFVKTDTVEETVEQALVWIAEHSPDEIIEAREEMLSRLEEVDREMRRSGTCQGWFDEADPETRKVAGHTNGLLLATLLEAAGHRGPGCALLLKEGRAV